MNHFLLLRGFLLTLGKANTGVLAASMAARLGWVDAP